MKLFNGVEKRLVWLFSPVIVLIFVMNSALLMAFFWHEEEQRDALQSEEYGQLAVNSLYRELELLESEAMLFSDSGTPFQFINNTSSTATFSLQEESWPDTLAMLEWQKKQLLKEITNFQEYVLSNESDALIILDLNRTVIFKNRKFQPELVDKILSKIESTEREKGLMIIDGELFFYIAQAVSDQYKQFNSNGHLTMFRLVFDTNLDTTGKNLDHSISIINHYKNKQAMKINLNDGLYSSQKSLIRNNDKIEVVYQLRTVDGVLLPIDIKVNFESDVERGNSDLLWLIPQFLSMLLLGLCLFLIVRKYITQPLNMLSRALNHLGKEKNKLNAETHTHINNRELLEVYSKFEALYIKMEHKNQFTEVLLGATGDIIITVDALADITFINPIAQQWLGFTEEELIGRGLSLFISSEDSTGSNMPYWLYNAISKKTVFNNRCQLRRLACPDKMVEAQVIVQALEGVVENKGAVVIIRQQKENTALL